MIILIIICLYLKCKTQIIIKPKMQLLNSYSYLAKGHKVRIELTQNLVLLKFLILKFSSITLFLYLI